MVTAWGSLSLKVREIRFSNCNTNEGEVRLKCDEEVIHPTFSQTKV